LTGLGFELLTDKFVNSTGVSTSAYFGTVADISHNPGSNLGCTLGTTTITFPSNISQGNFMITYQVYGTPVSVTAT